MKRFDAHLHINEFNASPKELIANLESCGIYGSNVFSIPPKGCKIMSCSGDYEERITDLLKFTKEYPQRFFPFLWVHPDEPDILNKIDDAVSRGVMGFKMICSNYFVYEDKVLKLLDKIAQSGKPVLFHTGILFDGEVSSNYNKPINWECCLEIPNLRFALAHCSWPWYDECIALYGKFLSSYTKRPDITAEMFLDITPGTPIPYRKDLLTKLHTIGYDIKHNILFGTDGRAKNYNCDFAKEWIARDDEIYKELGLDTDTLECIYGDNLMRFLGLPHKTFKRKITMVDGTVKEVEL